MYFSFSFLSISCNFSGLHLGKSPIIVCIFLNLKWNIYKEVMESISCNGGDVFDFEILYETNISLNAKKSVNVKSISKTSPSSSNFRSSSSEKKKV